MATGSPRARWVTALAVSAALVIAAPFVGDLQRWLLRTLGAAYVPVVNAVVGALTIAAVGAAIVRIRERRVARYLLIAAAAGLAVAFAWRLGLASAESSAVERFHFVEYGVITWLFYRAALGQGGAPAVVLAVAAACAFSVAAADEWFQHLAPGRIGEVRDICMNTAAIVCGLLVSAAVAPPPRGGGDRRASRRALTGAAVVALALIASFVHAVHLGTLIDDGEVAFLSRYDAGGLARRAAAFDPAAPALRGVIEDQYLTEALWHVQARNTLWGAGDLAGAWGENRILEKYFAPALAAGHAWPPEQRADAARRLAAAAPGAGPHRSHAERLPIWRLPGGR
jgi:hypothetical protein